jgi:hypothetical protein
MEAEQVKAEEEARRANPEAVAEREASGTAYEGLSPEAAQKLVGEDFSGLVDDPAGGPPRLAEGQRVTGFPSLTSMSVDLGGGEHGVVQSLEPLAVETASGQRVPVDLSLASDAVFQGGSA